ncbi:MAG TPA: flagellar hook protein FlgE [Terriglobales bacterium]|nr:flagellar hook protein FlgE [Terriglobales bacterium]
MASFSVALSGLSASEQALNVISNNLANLNTTGYKDQSANFQSLFYQNVGSDGAGEPIQVGAGVQVGSVSTNFTNGTVNNTGVPSDVAISGNGFFVTQAADGTVQYTRAGDFTVNALGQLVSPNGDTVMGYPAVNGAVDQNGGLAPIYLGQSVTSPPSQTTTMQQQTNLDANATVGTVYSVPLTVYDSLGESHVLTFTYTNTGPGTWTYAITSPGATVGAAGNGTLTFGSNGDLTTPAGSVPGITVSGFADGAANMSITWDLTGPNGTALMTQVAAASSTATTNQNGYSSGTLQNYTVEANGTIDGTFSNGQVQPLGQIALANFPDTEGLQLVGQNSYVPTLASGAAVVGVPQTGSLGALTGGALEASNVDISTEFTNLIITQRAFEANARMITTLDTVTNDTVNLQAAPGN